MSYAIFISEVIKYFVSKLKISDKYLESSLINLMIMTRNFNTSFYSVFLVYLHVEDTQFGYYLLIQFVLLNILRFLLHIRFNINKVTRSIVYFFTRLFVNYSQNQIIQLRSDNYFDPIYAYFQIRNIIIYSIFLITACPIAGATVSLISISIYFVLKSSINNSEFSSFDNEGIRQKKHFLVNQINYFGCFFINFFYYEILQIIIMVITVYVYKYSCYYSYIPIAVNELLLLSHFNSLNKHTFKTNLSYSNCKFIRKIEDSKWVDINKITNDIRI